MIAEVYLLVNSLGTKTRQWVIVSNGRAFPEVLINLALARAMAWAISRQTSLQSDMSLKDREKMWVKARAKIIKEIAATVSIEKGKCPLGRMWTGAIDMLKDAFNAGFDACLTCSHLRMGEARAERLGRSSVPDGRWECGAILQEVLVARKLADR